MRRRYGYPILLASGIAYVVGFLLLFGDGFTRIGYPIVLFLPILFAAWFMGAWTGILLTVIAMAGNVLLMIHIGAPRLLLGPHFAGLLVGVFLSVSFSRLRGLTHELRTARDAAQQSSRAKTLFLANMSHEIRTPMNAILGMVDLLYDTNPTPEQKKYLRVLNAAGESLLALINEVLDLSRIEAGRLELKEQQFALVEFMESTVEILGDSAREKGLDLSCRIAADTPPNLVGDPVRLRQVLLNLVGNAIKFTSSGSVNVDVGNAGPVADGHLRFLVTDTGIGVPLEKRDLVFQEFTQVDESTTRRFGGSGLGLSISRRLVGAMQGSIRCYDNPDGAGSVFDFTVHLAVAESAGTRSAPAPPEQFAGKRVLVVDDNPVNRDIMRAILVGWGMRVDEASRGVEALDMLRAAPDPETGPYDLCLLDFAMPGLDGLQTYDRIMTSPAAARTAVLILTSHVFGDGVFPFRSEHMPPVRTKPIRRADLLSAIAELLHLPIEPEQVSSRGRVGDDEPGAMRVLLAEDNPDNRVLVDAYLADTPVQLLHANNGAEAVDIWRQSEPDLILMDIQMPVMDGYTAARRIRALEKQRGDGRVPIVALTASALPEDVERSLAAGCDYHLPKPVSRRTLVSMLRRASTDRKGRATPDPAEADGSE